MSFPFRDRDRPSLRDRLKGFGKSGDEIMEELKQSLDEDTKHFFESNSKFGRPSGFSRVSASSYAVVVPLASTFDGKTSFPGRRVVVQRDDDVTTSKALANGTSSASDDRLALSRHGFPFDDDVTHGKSKLKDHLEDLAKRHPELADQLKDWTDIERSPKIPRKFSGGLGGQETGGDGDQQRVQQQQTTEGPSGPGPSKAPNLRATVPDMQAQQEKDQQRNQRSQSAPPEGPPVKGTVPAPADPNSTQQPSNESNQNHQHNHGQQNNQSHQQPQQQQQPQSRSNERYIPIFVEGRGETIVNVPAQNDRAQPQPQPATQTPPPRQKKTSFPKTPSAGPPPSAPQPPPAASAPSPQAAPSQETVPPPQSEPQATAAPPPQPPRPPSPLTQVAIIEKEVEEFRQRVEAFKGAKTDKEYIYLDEMLTRNLLKLDNIDSEGRDEVRAARKEVIRSIQQCINKLETAPSAP